MSPLGLINKLIKYLILMREENFLVPSWEIFSAPGFT
jgi:hypothetical protein